MVNCVVIYTLHYTNRIMTNFNQLFEIILKLFSISCLESFNITLNNFQIFFFIRKFDELRLELINCRCIIGINVGILFYIYLLMWSVWSAWTEVFARARSDMFSVCLFSWIKNIPSFKCWSIDQLNSIFNDIICSSAKTHRILCPVRWNDDYFYSWIYSFWLHYLIRLGLPFSKMYNTWVFTFDITGQKNI